MSIAPRPAGLFLTLAAGLVLSGCHYATHRPGGSGASKDQHVFESTAWKPVTVTLIDTRDDEEFFSVDVPIGQKFVFQFFDRQAKLADPATPDTMRWAMYESRLASSPLTNTLPVPSKDARQILVSYRPTPEFPPKSAEGPDAYGQTGTFAAFDAADE